MAGEHRKNGSQFVRVHGLKQLLHVCSCGYLLFRMLSRGMGRSRLAEADCSADQKVAAFLVLFSRRLAARGFSPTRFQLTMSRTDIASHLQLAPETVSRVLLRFQRDGLLRVDRREIELLARDRLDALAAPVLT